LRLLGESALIVPVPELEPIVGDLRARFDVRASEGVPAHITVLYPFMPHPIPDAIFDELRRLFARCARFEYRLVEVGRWPDNLHLLPAPSEGFVALTKAVWDAFPAYPPYEGRHTDVVPHLTVAQGPTDLLDEAEPLFRRTLPVNSILAVCEEVALFTNAGGTWQEATRFVLDSSQRGSRSGAVAKRPEQQ
jgi:2'-5' RNA ligase